jgi:1-acyl-sn-glycerol-3-phosphate acyltransferase
MAPVITELLDLQWLSVLDGLVDDDLRSRMARMNIETNEFGYDRWGACPRDALRVLALVRWLYRHYFRVSAHGLEHVPQGRVLLIGNHSAQLAYDGMLIGAALALEGEPPRFVRAMIERFFGNVPLVSILMARMGQLLGVPENALRLLTEDEAAVLVFPEGQKGGGKVFRDRYKLMGFGQGFLRMALQARAPIVPFGFIGGEEMVPSFSRMEPLAHLLGTPYTPLTPTVLPLPLPTKCSVYFGAPLRFEGHGDEPDAVVQPMVHQVEKAVADLIARGLSARQSVWFG